jgi:hypothetical protein
LAALPSQQSARHIAFAVQRQSGFEIFHARYTANGLDAFHSVHVAKGRLLPNVSPSLFIDDAGLVKFEILTAPDDQAHTYTPVEAEFDISGKSAGDPKLTSFDVAGPPATGAVLYSQNQGQPVRRDAVVAVKRSRHCASRPRRPHVAGIGSRNSGGADSTRAGTAFDLRALRQSPRRPLLRAA